MLQITPHMRLMLAVELVDFRKGRDGLALPFTHKIILHKTVPAMYVFRHEPTKPNITDPVKIQ